MNGLGRAHGSTLAIDRNALALVGSVAADVAAAASPPRAPIFSGSARSLTENIALPSAARGSGPVVGTRQHSH